VIIELLAAGFALIEPIELPPPAPDVTVRVVKTEVIPPWGTK
jgi:hypothetical protein